jgi:hypothetical protein
VATRPSPACGWPSLVQELLDAHPFSSHQTGTYKPKIAAAAGALPPAAARSPDIAQVGRAGSGSKAAEEQKNPENVKTLSMGWGGVGWEGGWESASPPHPPHRLCTPLRSSSASSPRPSDDGACWDGGISQDDRDAVLDDEAVSAAVGLSHSLGIHNAAACSSSRGKREEVGMGVGGGLGAWQEAAVACRRPIPGWRGARPQPFISPRLRPAPSPPPHARTVPHARVLVHDAPAQLAPGAHAVDALAPRLRRSAQRSVHPHGAAQEHGVLHQAGGTHVHALAQHAVAHDAVLRHGIRVSYCFSDFSNLLYFFYYLRTWGLSDARL